MIETLPDLDDPLVWTTTCLTFDVGRDTFAAPVAVVREILDPRPMAPTPNHPAQVAGVIDLHGERLAVLDLRDRDRACAGVPSAACVVVLGVDGPDGPMIGVLVDRVREVVEIALDHVAPVVDAPTGWSAAALRGVVWVHGRRVHMLNLPRRVRDHGRPRVLH